MEKYLKLVISNAALIGMICFLIYTQKLDIEGALPIYFTWIFASPFMVLAFNNSYILLKEEGTYQDNQKRVASIGTSIVALAFVGAGALSYSQGNQDAFLILTYCFCGFTPLVLFQLVVYGLLYDLEQVLKNQDKTEYIMDPKDNPDSFVYFYMEMLAGIALFWGLFSLITMQTRRYPRNACCCRIRGLK